MAKNDTPTAAPAGQAATANKAEGETKGPKPLPVPAGGWPRDNYTGHFGNFVRDPFTGVRSPADEETRLAMLARGIVSATELAPEPPPAPPAPVAE